MWLHHHQTGAYHLTGFVIRSPSTTKPQWSALIICPWHAGLIVYVFCERHAPQHIDLFCLSIPWENFNVFFFYHRNRESFEGLCSCSITIFCYRNASHLSPRSSSCISLYPICLHVILFTIMKLHTPSSGFGAQSGSLRVNGVTRYYCERRIIEWH